MFHFQIKLLRMIYYFTTKEENQDEKDERKTLIFSPSASVDFKDF